MTVDEIGDWNASGSAKKTALNKWELESLDKLRDYILQTPGNTTCVLTTNDDIPL